MVEERTLDANPVESIVSVDNTAPIAAPAGEKSPPTPSDGESTASTSEQNGSAAPAVQTQSSALSARMARFKSLQATKAAGTKETIKAVQDERKRLEQPTDAIKKLQNRHDEAAYKLSKLEDPDGRKRAWDYMVDESENWDKRQAKKQKNKDSNVFNDYSKEANKTYKRQVKRMADVNREKYQLQKAEKIRDQLQRGVLILAENANGDPVAVDPVTGRENEPAEEEYQFNHKPDVEDVDRAVNDEEQRQKSRMAARAKRLGNQDDSGDVTYINEKNKQFNNKLARFYNKFTAEIRENFERGTAI